MDIQDTYQNPLNARYASKEMSYIFSNNNKYITWRKLWLELAKAQQKVGLNISNNAIEELTQNLTSINYETVKEYEKQTKHEVMAHLKAYASQCQNASKILHLGETSAYIMDNSDLIIYKQALDLIEKRLITLMNYLSKFCDKNKAIATLSFTHFQPAQPTTVGKRGTLWLQSFLFDLEHLNFFQTNIKLRGVKGTTGTAASFKKLLNNDYSKLLELDSLISKSFNFSSSLALTSQIYDRKIDVFIGDILKSIAISAHKTTNDLRLLQHLKEIEENFSSNQIGSSAMPYKTNPILSERISSLSKFIISLNSSTDMVAITQWLERTLDDSANKRLSLPQMFLATDSILNLLSELFEGIKVNHSVINKNLQDNLPFLITENILMDLVKQGANRQTLHEEIKKLSLQALENIKEGKKNNLMDLILKNPIFNLQEQDINAYQNEGELIGYSIEQTEYFLKDIDSLLKKNQSKIIPIHKSNI